MPSYNKYWPEDVLMKLKHVTKTVYYWIYIDVVLWLNKILYEYWITQRSGFYQKKKKEFRLIFVFAGITHNPSHFALIRIKLLIGTQELRNHNEVFFPSPLFTIFLGFGCLSLHSILTNIQLLFLPDDQRLNIRAKRYKTLFLLNLF